MKSILILGAFLSYTTEVLADPPPSLPITIINNSTNQDGIMLELYLDQQGSSPIKWTSECISPGTTLKKTITVNEAGVGTGVGMGSMRLYELSCNGRYDKIPYGSPLEYSTLGSVTIACHSDNSIAPVYFACSMQLEFGDSSEIRKTKKEETHHPS